MVNINENEINLEKHPEQRLVGLIGTVQKSVHTSSWEEDFLGDLLEGEIRCSRIATGNLSSNPTKNGNGSEFTHQFQIDIILESNVTLPCDYIWRRLRRHSFEYDRGRRIFFKLRDIS